MIVRYQTLDATYAIPRAGSSKIAEMSRAPSLAPAVGTTNGDVSMSNEGGEEGEEGPQSGWVVGEGLVKMYAEEGADERYEQRWPFRATEGPQDWEGRAYVL